MLVRILLVAFKSFQVLIHNFFLLKSFKKKLREFLKIYNNRSMFAMLLNRIVFAKFDKVIHTFVDMHNGLKRIVIPLRVPYRSLNNSQPPRHKLFNVIIGSNRTSYNFLSTDINFILSVSFVEWYNGSFTSL